LDKENVIRNHHELYLAKPLHGQFMQDIGNEFDRKFQWSWLRQGKETEGFIMAAQEQALTTNIIKSRIHHLCLLFVGYVILVMRQWTIWLVAVHIWLNPSIRPGCVICTLAIV